MKKNLQQYSAIIAITIIAIFIVQCKKSPAGDTTPASIKTKIADISPLQGLAGTLVTITGAGFDTTRLTTSVKFNGESAIIKSLTTTQMTVEVPAKATSGKITIINKDTTIIYPAIFTVNSLTANKLPATGIFEGVAISNIAVDFAGNIYCNTNTDTIFKISPSGVKSMLAVAGNINTQLGGIAVDATGNVYTVGTNDFKIYKITPGGSVSIFAGTGISGYTDGPGTVAQFTAPAGMAIDATGNLFVTDVYRVRKISSTGQVSTFAGNAKAGRTDGQGALATFGSYGNLKHIAVNASGNIYVSDGDYGIYASDNKDYYIRKITPGGAVSSMGPIPTQRGNQGPGPMSLPFTSLLAVDAAGNLYLPGSTYSTGTNASQGCCTFGPIFTVNNALSSSLFYDITNMLPVVRVNYTDTTVDPSGNIYISAAVTAGSDYIFLKNDKAGSLVLKFTIK